jgi:putative SOS response-associated peptidase YedK
MCGRYTVTVNPENYREYCLSILDSHPPSEFTTDENVKPVPRYNIVPASHVGAIFQEDGTLKHQVCHWWILPPFAAADAVFTRHHNGLTSFRYKAGARKSHFNSRYDTITNPKNRYWHTLLKTKRCVIVADGFYEWPAEELLPEGAEKIPHYFRLRSMEPFCFAGLWEKVTDDVGLPFYSVNIITVEPNELLRALPHHRMPAILKDAEISSWLDTASGLDTCINCLHRTPAELMEGFAVNKYINYAKNDFPDCIKPFQADNVLL